MISVLTNHQSEDGTVGTLPTWWYRVYYIYTAATILIAAKLRPDDFVLPDINQFLSDAMSILKAHEKFGQSARRCGAALSILSSKLLQDMPKSGPQLPNGTASEPSELDQLPGYTWPLEFVDLEGADATFTLDAMSFWNMHGWEFLNAP